MLCKLARTLQLYKDSYHPDTERVDLLSGTNENDEEISTEKTEDGVVDIRSDIPLFKSSNTVYHKQRKTRLKYCATRKSSDYVSPSICVTVDAGSTSSGITNPSKVTNDVETKAVQVC